MQITKVFHKYDVRISRVTVKYFIVKKYSKQTILSLLDLLRYKFVTCML